MRPETNKFKDSVLDLIQTLPEFGFSSPDVVYHFTDAAGLIGIVETNTLWASQASTLNDASELTYAISVARAFALSRLSKSKGHDKTFWKDLLGDLHTTRRNTLRQVYVTSFCVKENTAALWLHYGRQGRGYALAFDPMNFRSEAWSFAPVIYQPRTQRKILASLLGLIVQKGNKMGAEQDVVRETFVDLVKTLAPIFKDPAFASDTEWRLITLDSDKPKIKFRASGSLVVPYTEFDIPKGSLSEVVLGNQMDASIDSVLLMLTKHKWKQFSVRISTVPVR